MKYSLNDTRSYHIHDLDTLGWEYTVCSSLEPPDAPLRTLLQKNATYGNLLYDFLESRTSIRNGGKILEVGGGYGYLMRDFLKRNQGLNATMVDISEYLLYRQKEHLADLDADYINEDFFNLDAAFLENFDYAVLNENTGDFPAVYDIDKSILTENNDTQDKIISAIRIFFSCYFLDYSGINEKFNFNLGAMTALERLCHAGVNTIFISEHSCESRAPDIFNEGEIIKPEPTPERIHLKGHDEYTIKFSHLEAVAKKFNYKTTRGPMSDYIMIDKSLDVGQIFRSTVSTGRMESIRHFIHDLYKYEYLLICKK